jgi:hypothetical protein
MAGFPAQEGDDLIQGVQVLRDDLFVLDPDAEILFDEFNELQDTCGIDNSLLHERFFIAKRTQTRFGQKALCDKASEFASKVHSIVRVIYFHRLYLTIAAGIKKSMEEL